MPSTALCIGLTYPPAGIPSANLSYLPGSSTNALILGSIAESMSIPTTTILTDDDDPESSPTITKSSILAQLESMAQSASPGDQFMLSLSGHAGQFHDADERDGHGECFYVNATGEFLTDDELTVALSRFPTGSSVFVVFDCSHAGTLVDFDQHSLQANVVVMSATLDDERAKVDDEGESVFVEALRSVLEQNPGASWREVAALVDVIDGRQTCNVSSNWKDFVDTTAFEENKEEEEDEPEEPEDEDEESDFEKLLKMIVRKKPEDQDQGQDDSDKEDDGDQDDDADEPANPLGGDSALDHCDTLAAAQELLDQDDLLADGVAGVDLDGDGVVDVVFEVAEDGGADCLAHHDGELLVDATIV